jgi:LacI family transcriptional regulator
MDRVRRIAILMGQDLSFCRKAIRGIRAYALSKPDWAFRNGPPELQIIPYLKDWKPDGMIANLTVMNASRAIIALRKPVIDTSNALAGLNIPVVDVDNVAVGRLAAEYLLDRRFTNFGFFGSKSVYSQLRLAGFREGLAKQGHVASVCYGEYLQHMPSRSSWKKMDTKIGLWLQQLPKPVAILACNDVPARSLADACRQLGLHIPEQVALLGVDDDEMECPLTSPPLSSVAIPAERIGYEAAKLLDRMMSGERPPKTPLSLPPLCIVTRQSTDTMAISDPVVLAALRHIRQHAAERITVGSVVRETGCGRRELERHFRRVLGRSVLTEIRITRVERAKEILQSTNLPMPAIAAQAGFASPERFAVVFRRLVGMSPSAYRRQSQIHHT